MTEAMTTGQVVGRSAQKSGRDAAAFSSPVLAVLTLIDLALPGWNPTAPEMNLVVAAAIPAVSFGYRIVRDMGWLKPHRDVEPRPDDTVDVAAQGEGPSYEQLYQFWLDSQPQPALGPTPKV